MPYLTPEDFIVAWQKSKTPEEAAAKLRKMGLRFMTARRASEWARFCRAVGVKLKRFPRKLQPATRIEAVFTQKEDVKKLIEVILTKQQRHQNN